MTTVSFDTSKLKKALVWVLTRFEEPSTFAGGGIVAALVATWFPGELGHQILIALSAIGAVLAIVLPEKKKA